MVKFIFISNYLAIAILSEFLDTLFHKIYQVNLNPLGQYSMTEKKDQMNSRAIRMKEIDELYNKQISQIYNESKQATQRKDKITQGKTERYRSPNINSSSGIRSIEGLTLKRGLSSQNILRSDSMTGQEQKSPVRIKTPKQDQLLVKNSLFVGKESRIDDQKVRASIYLQGESTQKIQILRKQIQGKQMKIRQLVNKCENLTDKLKNFLSPEQLQNELQSIKEYSDRKIQRLQNLLKIKNEQIFFKMKLQIIRLLQEFEVSKEEIDGIKEVNTESSLFSFMERKLKMKLKDIRTKESENTQKIQKDYKINQHFEDRINYLSETNELMKLTETKLKNKIEDLKSQLNTYIDKIKEKELEVEERQNQVFRLKKQNEELQVINQKMTQNQRSTLTEKSDEKKFFDVRQKELTNLLNSYYLERKKLENLLEEKEGQIEEILIREKFLQAENERLNREYIRWKERYEWVEKQKQNRQRQHEEDKNQLLEEFEQYKKFHNESVEMSYKVELDEANRKLQSYQEELQKLLENLEQERKNNALREEQTQIVIEESEREWLDKVKRLEQAKQTEIFEMQQDHDLRLKQQKENFQKNQQLLMTQMQARMKALLAQNDKKSTQKLIEIENENDELRREIQIMKEHINAKASYENTLSKKLQGSNGM